MLRDAIEQMTPRETIGADVEVTLSGTRWIPKARKFQVEGGAEFRRVTIQTISRDYVDAWVGQIGNSELLRVAKPRLLRPQYINGATRDGASFSVPASSGDGQTRDLTVEGVQSISATERIFPLYQVGDIIIVHQPEGGTDLIVNNVEITWEDVNEDARTWALPYTVVAVCINNNMVPMLVRADASG